MSVGSSLERWLIRAGVASLVVLAFVRFERLLWSAVTTILLIISPLLPVDARNIPSSRADRHVMTTPLDSARVPGRVLVLVFDQMDQRLTFVKRPPGVSLPAPRDRLRAESFYATATHSHAVFALSSGFNTGTSAS